MVGTSLSGFRPTTLARVRLRSSRSGRLEVQRQTSSGVRPPHCTGSREVCGSGGGNAMPTWPRERAVAGFGKCWSPILGVKAFLPLNTFGVFKLIPAPQSQAPHVRRQGRRFRVRPRVQQRQPGMAHSINSLMSPSCRRRMRNPWRRNGPHLPMMVLH